MAELSIFLIYNERADDTINISPIMDRFRITFKSRHHNIHHLMYCTEEETFRYVDDLVHLLPSDAEPYSSIQFNFPCFPSVIYSLATLNNIVVRNTVRNRLYSLLKNWPEVRPIT